VGSLGSSCSLLQGVESVPKVGLLQLLAKPINGEEVVRDILSVLSTELGIQSSDLLAGIRDRASVNNVAMHLISVMYPTVLDVGCFSYTLNNVGEQFRTLVLDKFMKHWQEMFSRSHKARLQWLKQTGRALKTYSPTRWWSRWECEKQLFELWGDVPSFLASSGDTAPKSREKLSKLLATKLEQLVVELAITIDVGEVLVKTTYTLEGDGPMAFKCYEMISAIKAALQVQHWSNTEAIIRSFPVGAQPGWRAYAYDCIKPANEYFKFKFETELQPVVSAYKSARLFNPATVNDLKPSASDIAGLKSFQFLENSISHLQRELPAYLAAADGVSQDTDLIKWWDRHSATLTHWDSAYRKVVLCQPTSAAVKRSFSVLKAMFGPQQDSALQDYVETAIMLHFNK